MKFTIAAAVAALATLSVASPAPAPEAAPIGAPVERQATPPLVESVSLLAAQLSQLISDILLEQTSTCPPPLRTVGQGTHSRGFRL